MKSIFATTIIWILAFVNFTLAGTDNTALSEALKDWKTVRISFIIDGGDYFPSPKYILLQRLDSESIILSTSENYDLTDALPVVRSIINNSAAQSIIDQAVGFYTTAQKEIGEKARIYALPQFERDEIIKKHNLGISAEYIGIQILSHSKSYEYKDDFADEGTTVKDFLEFVIHPLKNTK